MANPRTDAARAHDDRDVIEDLDKAPAHGGTSGGNLQRDIGSRAEKEHSTRDEAGITRVGAKDKPKQANLPRRNA